MRFLYVILAIMLSYGAHAKSISEINLLVDSNLADPIREAVREYTQISYVSVAVQLSDYGNLLNLKTKDTDIVITMDESKVDFLQAKEIITLGYDNLALFSVLDYQIRFDGDFKNEIRYLSKFNSIVIVNKNKSMSGLLSSEILSSIGLDDIVQVRSEDIAIELLKRRKGIGLLLHSDGVGLGLIADVPDDLYKPLKYQLLVMKDKDSESVKKFLQFLLLNKYLFTKYRIKVR